MHYLIDYYIEYPQSLYFYSNQNNIFGGKLFSGTVINNNTATFTGLVTATTTTIDAATTFTAGVAGGTNVTMGNGDVLTVAGNTITSTNIKFTNATSQLILSGSDVTITGDINATSTTDSGIITLNGAQTTFVGNVGAAAATNVLIMTVAAGKRAVITETANFIEHIDFGAAVGAGYKFDNGFFLDARYNRGFSELYEGSDARNSVINLGIGFMF